MLMFEIAGGKQFYVKNQINFDFLYYFFSICFNFR